MSRLRKSNAGSGARRRAPPAVGRRTATGGELDREMLRWLADAAEQALRARVRLQRGMQAATGTAEVDAEGLLAQMHAHALEERRLSHAVARLVRQHPAWTWLERFGSINPMVVGKLLARLDVHTATSPEHFWRQCDLSVVRGIEYACERCARVVTIREGRSVDRHHRDPRTGEACSGALRPSRGSRRRVLIATSRADSESSADPLAKRYLHLTVNALIRGEQPYAKLHQLERERIHRDRPQWHASRKHFGALRKVKKRFLVELWVAWRAALGLPGAHGTSHDLLQVDAPASEAASNGVPDRGVRSPGEADGADGRV